MVDELQLLFNSVTSVHRFLSRRKVKSLRDLRDLVLPQGEPCLTTEQAIVLVKPKRICTAAGTYMNYRVQCSANPLRGEDWQLFETVFDEASDTSFVRLFTPFPFYGYDTYIANEGLIQQKRFGKAEILPVHAELMKVALHLTDYEGYVARKFK